MHTTPINDSLQILLVVFFYFSGIFFIVLGEAENKCTIADGH